MEDIEQTKNIFGVEAKPIGIGLKYLSFNIKPNTYKVKEWFYWHAYTAFLLLLL